MLRHAFARYFNKSNAKTIIIRCEFMNHNNVCNLPLLTTFIITNNLHLSNLTYNSKHATNIVPSELEKNSQNLTEQEYLVKIKNDPDTFGVSVDYEQSVDEGDLEEAKYFEEQPEAHRKLSTKQYADEIKALLKKRKIKEAIDFVEIRMIKEDRVKPENYIFNLLLGGCGRVGYTKEAFSLYNQMKKRSLKVTPGTYTALFNACANSPWPTTDGLTRAKQLQNIMIEKMYEPNDTNYHAMIKAFGRCGDLSTAFALVDEMAAKKIAINGDTFNFLLQACITDKEAGFRHALLVWRKFIERKIQPSIYSYNLMLRCIRDCGLGDIKVTEDVISKLLSQNAHKLLLNEPTNNEAHNRLLENDAKSLPTANTLPVRINEHEESNVNSLANNKNAPNTNEISNFPNLMAKVPHLGNVLSLSEVTKPSDRLLLVGGYSNFLNNMKENDCTPDIKTFTQLLDSIPDSVAAEKEVLGAFKKHRVRPDIDFFNMLIKKRSMRFDYQSAQEVLLLIEKAGLSPDLVTYGVLALGCKTKEEAQQLIEQMNEAKYRLNAPILGAMLRQACCHNNIPYVMQIMELCLKQEVKPNKQFMECLEEFKKKCKKISNDKDNPLSQNQFYQKGYQIFKMRHKTWLKDVEIDETEEAHPWQQYRQATGTNVRHYKDQKSDTTFKPRHTSLFKKKTSTKIHKKYNKK